jgi:16S rRNA processing protein RimM
VDQEGRAALEHRQAPDRPRELSARLVAIGEILRPHGLDGEVKVKNLTEDPGRFDRLRGCIVWDPVRDVREPRRIDRVRRHGGALIVKLGEVDGPGAARQLTGRLLAVTEADAAPLPAGHLYPWQLEGCRVETEEGTLVGTIAGIEPTPAQDLWVVGDGAREHLIPAVPEIVRAVDLRARRVVIRPPAGLLDL